MDDSTTSGGKLLSQIFGAIAELERNLTWEWTQAGLAATGARGRPKKLDAFKAEMAQRLYNDKSNAIDVICKTLGISPVTLYRNITREKTDSAPIPS
jgi:DNA invertase Pin-like site-specific DNA recombinase